MLKVITTGFDYGESNKYDVLMKVFLYSVEKNCPKAQWICNWLEEPETDGIVRAFISNTVKLDTWVREMEMSDEGDCLVFMDCDMLVLDDLSPAFEEDFDLAYTYRTDSKWPVNGGVIFCKVNERSISFMKRFLEINNKMLQDKEFHQKYRDKYAGMNQAAFGYMLEEEPNICKMVPIPCAIWNVCGNYDEALENGAKVLHVKGQFRKHVFSNENPQKELEKAIALWKSYFEEFKRSGNK
jgi:hypothetical protein